MSKNILLLAVIAGGVYLYSNRNTSSNNSSDRGSGYAYDTTQEVKLNRATDGSGGYQLPIDIIKRGGPTTTEFDTIYRPPTQFGLGIMPIISPEIYLM